MTKAARKDELPTGATADKPTPGAGARIALVGEARGEHLFLRSVAARLRERLGHDAGMHIELDPRDLTSHERSTTFLPSEHPLLRAAMTIPSRELAGRVAACEERHEIPSLRRLWRGELQLWREGVSEEQLARQAIGYVEAFDALLREHPELIGGYFEESARLMKRAFRAVALKHGRRTLVSIGIPFLGRTALVDQESFSRWLPPLDGFEPTREQLEEGYAHVRAARTRESQFAWPRDLGLSLSSVRNFAALVRRSLQPSVAGNHAARPGLWAREWTQQRARLLALDRIAVRSVTQSRAIFYPMHFAHDAQVTIRGEAYRDQFALLHQIADAVPYGYEVWTKPHPATPGDLPVSRYLALRRQKPNVRLLHPAVPVPQILEQVDAVVTINSTVGFEALLHGVPVLTFGDSPFRGRGLTHDLTGPAELSRAIPQAIRQGAPSDEDVARFLAWLVTVTHPMTVVGLDVSAENAGRYADALITDFELALRSRE